MADPNKPIKSDEVNDGNDNLNDYNERLYVSVETELGLLLT